MPNKLDLGSLGFCLIPVARKWTLNNIFIGLLLLFILDNCFVPPFVFFWVSSDPPFRHPLLSRVGFVAEEDKSRTKEEQF